MQKYIIIEGEYEDRFIEKVNKKLAEGWECQGGVSMSVDGGGSTRRRYCQAMYYRGQQCPTPTT